MKRIGVRELRQNASVYLRDVQRGESFEITDRGRAVALLVPRPTGRIEELMASGRLYRQGAGRFEELPEPLEPIPGQPLLSEVLQGMRDEERY